MRRIGTIVVIERDRLKPSCSDPYGSVSILSQTHCQRWYRIRPNFRGHEVHIPHKDARVWVRE